MLIEQCAIRYGRDQSCAMLLAVLSASSAVFAANSPGAASTVVTSEVKDTARKAFFEIGGRPTLIQRGLQGHKYCTPSERKRGG